MSSQLPVAVLLVAVGLAACFAGYRIFRIILAVYGFLLGALFASSFVSPGETTMLIVALLVGGLLGALAMWVGYLVGVALVGAGLAALAAQSLWLEFGRQPSMVVIIVGAAIGAALAVSWQRYVLIVGTAFIGAQTAVAGALAFLRRGAAPDLAMSAWLDRLRFPNISLEWPFLAWVALGIVGTLVQLRSGGKTLALRRR